MELSVLNKEGKDTGEKIVLSSDVFGVEPNNHVVYLDVKHFLANQRQGTHKAKEKGEITGSTRKLKKQKGTGTARAGSIKSPVFRGGGRVFGPRPRSYSFKLNKKVRAVAKRSVLSYKAQNEGITILAAFALEQPSTKSMLTLLDNLSLNNLKTIVVTSDYNKNVYLSSRNLKKAKVSTAAELSTYDVLHADKLVILKDAVNQIENALKL